MRGVTRAPGVDGDGGGAGGAGQDDAGGCPGHWRWGGEEKGRPDTFFGLQHRQESAQGREGGRGELPW